jgi:hypothetical protein
MTAASIEKAAQETYCVDFFLETDKGDLFSFIYTDDPLPLLIKETAQKDDKFAGQLKALEQEFGAITARFEDFWLDTFGVCSTYAFINDEFE